MWGSTRNLEGGQGQASAQLRKEGLVLQAGDGVGGAQIPQMSVGGGDTGSGVHPWGRRAVPDGLSPKGEVPEPTLALGLEG